MPAGGGRKVRCMPDSPWGTRGQEGTSMDAMDCIKGRASVRRFKQDGIPDIVLDEVLEAAIAAPSAGNCQDWEFVVVRKPENRKRLASACMGQKMIEQAPVVVVVCSNTKKISRYGERGETLYTIQDAATATQNLMLAAWSKDIGSCWVGAFDEAEVSQLLVLPGHVRPMAVVPLGYPEEKPEKPRRWELKDFVHKEHF
jgi:nitroreductase